jgi:hypothetical protein
VCDEWTVTRAYCVITVGINCATSNPCDKLHATCRIADNKLLCTCNTGYTGIAWLCGVFTWKNASVEMRRVSADRLSLGRDSAFLPLAWFALALCHTSNPRRPDATHAVQAMVIFARTSTNARATFPATYRRLHRHRQGYGDGTIKPNRAMLRDGQAKARANGRIRALAKKERDVTTQTFFHWRQNLVDDGGVVQKKPGTFDPITGQPYPNGVPPASQNTNPLPNPVPQAPVKKAKDPTCPVCSHGGFSGSRVQRDRHLKRP